jgi:hypothetical protein
MSMGTRDKRQRQHGLWIAASDLPVTAAQPFYERVNALLDDHYFDGQTRCLVPGAPLAAVRLFR